jgi:hypothetical protein
MMKKYYKKVESVEINALLGELDNIEACLDRVSGPTELKVYNKNEICSVLGVNEKQLRDYRFKGKLSYTRVGDKYWYTQDDIDEFMAKHHRKAFA